MAKSAESVAEVLGEISRDHLECSICQDRYRTPKILHCLHSFCEKCLLTYHESAQDPAVMKCPTCRQVSTLTPDGIKGMKTNFHLMEIVADVALKERLSQKEGVKLLCELCEDQREAQARCMDCPFLLCRQCQGAHRRIAATANHEVLTLDGLRSSATSLQRKVKVGPPCEKHPDEKKRFFCKTCTGLICRDCIIMEHRDHTFATIDEVASLFRQNMKELIEKLKRKLSAFQQAKDNFCEMDVDLDKSVLSCRQHVIEQATAEEDRISQNEGSILQDISQREMLREKALGIRGVTLTRQPRTDFISTIESRTERNQYCKTTEDALSSIDNSLDVLNTTLETLLKTEENIRVSMANLKDKVQKDAKFEKTKLALSKQRLLLKIEMMSTQKKDVIKELDKITTVNLEHMQHALDVAVDVVTSASDVDLLNLKSLIDDDIHALLEQSPPKLHLGYPQIEFKRSDGTGLGEIEPGTLWNLTAEIVPRCGGHGVYGGREKHRTHRRRHKYFDVYDSYGDKVTIMGIDKFQSDKVFIGCREVGATLWTALMYNTAGSRIGELGTFKYAADRAVILPDGSFVTFQVGSRWLCVYSQSKMSAAPNRFQLHDSGAGYHPVSIAAYDSSGRIIVGYSNVERPVVHGDAGQSLAEQDDVEKRRAEPIEHRKAHRERHERRRIERARLRHKPTDGLAGSYWKELYTLEDSMVKQTDGKEVEKGSQKEATAQGQSVPLGDQTENSKMPGSITVHNSTDGSVVREMPVSVQPDLLAFTSNGRILFSARSPACVEGIEGDGATTGLVLRPTVEGLPDGEPVRCEGICCDIRDYIYVAVSSESATRVHVHQYSPHGTFMACLPVDTETPFSGIVVTGDDIVVVAEQHKLKLFEMAH